jgi:hypothetical protein
MVAVRWVRCAATWVDLTAPTAKRHRRCGQLVRADDGLCVDHQRQQQALAAQRE